jgi:hypothetical protein
MYWFKRKKEQVGRVIDFLPLIWNSYDFDYSYSIALFKKQLERQAKFMESEKSSLVRAKDNAKRIRTAIALIENVYDEKYIEEAYEYMEKLYGKRDLIEDKEGYIDFVSEKAVNEEHQKDINRIYYEVVNLAIDRTKRAEDILWRFIAHNIRRWWD